MEIIQIEWSEERPPSEACHYNHVIGKTPLGEYRITWKGWKEDQNFVIDDFDGSWLDARSELEEAKAVAQGVFEKLIKQCVK